MSRTATTAEDFLVKKFGGHIEWRGRHPNRSHVDDAGKKEMTKRTYNTMDSLVVTDPTTSLALTGLSMGERTGSRIFQWVWSYMAYLGLVSNDEGLGL